MYSFSKTLSNKEIQWINESIEYVKKLYIPISDDIYFKHCHGFKEIGWCKTEEDSKKAKCTIALSIYLNIHEDTYEIDFKQVCIHELLHTIKNKNKDPHGGSWQKYQFLINNLYNPIDTIHKYEITRIFRDDNLRLAKRNRLNSMQK